MWFAPFAAAAVLACNNPCRAVEWHVRIVDTGRSGSNNTDSARSWRIARDACAQVLDDKLYLYRPTASLQTCAKTMVHVHSAIERRYVCTSLCDVDRECKASPYAADQLARFDAKRAWFVGKEHRVQEAIAVCFYCNLLLLFFVTLALSVALYSWCLKDFTAMLCAARRRDAPRAVVPDAPPKTTEVQVAVP